MIHKTPAVAAGAFAWVTLGSLTFLIILLVSPPTLWYLPLEREFYFGQSPPTLAMDFYGRTLMSVAVGALGGVGIYAGFRLIPEGQNRRYGGLILGGFALLSIWTAAGLMAGALVGKMLAP